MTKTRFASTTRRAALMALGAFLLSGCASQAVKQTEAERATDELRTTATPKALPRQTITNFSESLSCMDDLFLRYNVSNMLIAAQDLPDQTTAVVAGSKDMLITALSRMSKKSNAFRFVALGSDLQDIERFHTQHANRQYQVPDFFIRGAITQADQSVVENQVSGGLAVTQRFSFQGSKDRIASIIGLDMNAGAISNLQILPGISSSNSIAVARRGKGLDATGTVRKLGAIFNFTYTKNEGLHHALRTLIELGTIELLGKLTQVPYWECLDLETTNPHVQQEIGQWYAALNDNELRTFVQAKLRSMQLYAGPVDGFDNPDLRTAIALFKTRNNLIGDSKLDLPLYYTLLADSTPIDSAYTPMLVREVVQEHHKGPEHEYEDIRTEVIPQKTGLPATAVTPLDFELTTSRGARPVFAAGETGSIMLRPSIDAHLACFYQTQSGDIVKIFPNEFQPSGFVEANSDVRIPGDDSFKIRFEKPNTAEYVTCIASYDNLDGTVAGELGQKSLQRVDLKRLTKLYKRPVKTLGDIASLYRQSASKTIPLIKSIRVKVK